MKLFADEENLGLGFRLIEIKAKDALRIKGVDFMRREVNSIIEGLLRLNRWIDRTKKSIPAQGVERELLDRESGIEKEVKEILDEILSARNSDDASVLRKALNFLKKIKVRELIALFDCLQIELETAREEAEAGDQVA
tara:strand:- start:284 stop:697 length:414 start_codon:yes stop_codon:yes gene_type:complete